MSANWKDKEIPMDWPRIITSHIFPPIPIRRFDWCAYRDGQEEAGNYGYGRTEQEAIANLLANEECDNEELRMITEANQ